jgi:hypothetical protein
MNKRYFVPIVTLIALIFFTAGNSMSQSNIIFLSDDNNDDNQIQFLERQGFNVFKFWASGGIATWGPDTIAMLNSADLIICGRSLKSDQFDGDDKPVWHSLTPPLILNSIHAGRSTRINFFNTTSTTEDTEPKLGYAMLPTDPIFDSVSLDPVDNSLQWFDRKSNYLIDTSATNGEIVVTMNDSIPLLVRFDANVPFYPGATDSAAGPRIYCGLGGEPDKQNHFPLSKEAKTVYLAEISRILGIGPSSAIFGATEYTITFFTDDENDDIQIAFLKEQGFAVEKFWADGGSSSWGQDTIDLMNESELIIVGRSPESSEFKDDNKPFWNALEAPMIFNNVFGAKYIGWSSYASPRGAGSDLIAEIQIPDDPILEFAPEISGETMDWLFSDTDYMLFDDKTNGTMVLSIGDTIPFVLRYEPDIPFYPGAADSASAPISFIPFGGSSFFPLTKNAQAVYFAEALRLLGLEISAPEFFGTDNTLSSIVVDKGTLEPAFQKDILSYDLALGANDNILNITATATEATSTVLRDGEKEINASTTVYVGCESQIGVDMFYAIKVTKEVSGIDDLTGYSDEFQVYPNPFSNRITIEASEQINFIEIINLQGKVIENISINNNKAEIDLSELNKGLYIIRAQTANNTYTNQVIKN